ncbi:DUF3822 family protein [Gelidibacter maritimus]|uniref:DUF3822 family protein n=1 Tax=Gelidibacter maritimus TaxID=2761487 RepID=A0A7W2M4J9_9FLAO|nr:DUF3822 family protein [Gelidibacter maritimus]MBA6152602.1 DUF3822 family protein [Gelidibacter maritimus]
MKSKPLETGLKTIQLISTLELNNLRKLSIQISLSGLSFCIFNSRDSEVEFLKRIEFKSKLTPEAVLEELQAVITNEPLLSQPFDTVLVLFQNELSNLVPAAFFEEQNAADYLKFSSKIIKTDFISYDKIEAIDSINVFVPYININNYLFETYGEFEYKHASSIFLEQILKEIKVDANEDHIYINVAPYHFEMVAIKAGKLQLYNTFEYFTKEDFIYFVLFAIEQLKLNTETVIVKLTGRITKGDELYQLLYTYIRYVEFDEPSKPYTFEDANQIQSKHEHTLILNSFN